MKRIQLFEFEDMSWFPKWIRVSITNLIVVLNKLMGVNEVLSIKITELLKSTNYKTIVDLGSGSGGAMPDVLNEIAKNPELKETKLIMTDLYPNASMVEKYKSHANIEYFPESVNATSLEQTPAGIKTMVNCFHHMPVPIASQILTSAQVNKQTLLIYELSDNKLPTLIWWLFLPISLVIMVVMVWVLTPMVRPLSFKQLFFTYIIPIIPVFYAWDGQASMPRTYSLSDYDELLAGLPNDNYKWEKGYLKNSQNKQKGTFLLGMPV